MYFEGSVQFSSVQSLSHVRLFATPWIAACQASNLSSDWIYIQCRRIKVNTMVSESECWNDVFAFYRAGKDSSFCGLNQDSSGGVWFDVPLMDIPGRWVIYKSFEGKSAMKNWCKHHQEIDGESRSEHKKLIFRNVKNGETDKRHWEKATSETGKKRVVDWWWEHVENPLWSFSFWRMMG